MITFSVCVSLVLLAIIAAIFSQQHSDWVLDIDRHRFFPPFFKSEGFYRAFLINLSYAGVSTAAGALQNVRYVSFWMICDPFLAILFNLGLGLFAALSLTAETKEFRTKERGYWTGALVIAGFLCFAFAVWATAVLTGASRQQSDANKKEVLLTFTKAPADDKLIRRWYEDQPGTSDVSVTRDHQQLQVHYYKATPVLGPSEDELRKMGYEGVVQIESTPSDQPLSWWLRYMPPSGWLVLAISSVLLAIILSLFWRAIRGRPASIIPSETGAPTPAEVARPAIDAPDRDPEL